MSDLSTIPFVPLLILGLACLALAGFLSAIEISLSSLSRAYVEDLAEDGSKAAVRLSRVLEERPRAVVGLHGARVVSVTVAVLSVTLVTMDLLQPSQLSWWVVALIVLGVMALIEVLMVLVLPWFMVSRNYLSVALLGSRLTLRLLAVTHWFDPLIGRASARLGSERSDAQRLAVAEDLREIADEVGEADSFDEEDKEMIRSVFELGQTRVREVMVPRTSMVTIESDKSLDKALRLFLRSGFSRVPVIGQDVDDAIGILYFKDVVRRLIDHADLAASPVMSYVRPAVFIPETRFVDDELREMQANNTHLALVIDEYGGVSGLVTLEDLIEELVGEVVDEHDRAELEPEQLAPNVWRVPARYSLNDLEELVGLEFDDEAVDSVGGLLTWAIDRVPLPGAEATVHGVHLVAEETVGRRNEVGSILVTRVDPEPAAEEEQGE
ncbi:hemolysin family protein [Scrofimicrobium sp. R131]|uniref:Hemolysin family protein n=1 Tax=Scrofimicrobium appendicitidis TaxID=3079930 RepID=A0AAU7V8X9_9ACTO